MGRRIRGPEGGPRSVPSGPARSRGRAGLRKGLTLGRPPAFAWSDQSPVTGPVPPLPSFRLSWKPSLAGSREQWVPPQSLGPCPPHPPPLPCQAWRLPSPEPKPNRVGRLCQGREELSSVVLPGLDFLPGKTSWGCGVGGASSYFAMGRASPKVSGLCLGGGGVHTKVLPRDGSAEVPTVSRHGRQGVCHLTHLLSSWEPD